MSRQNKDMPAVSGQKIASIKRITEVVKFADFTDGGSASGTVDLSNTIPAGAVVLGATLEVQISADGTNPDIQLGDGSDADRYNTGTPGVGSTGVVDLGVPSGQRHHGSEATVTVTLAEDTDFGNISQFQGVVGIVYI